MKKLVIVCLSVSLVVAAPASAKENDGGWKCGNWEKQKTGKCAETRKCTRTTCDSGGDKISNCRTETRTECVLRSPQAGTAPKSILGQSPALLGGADQKMIRGTTTADPETLEGPKDPLLQGPKTATTPPAQQVIKRPSTLVGAPTDQVQRSPALLERPQDPSRPGLLERPELLERPRATMLPGAAGAGVDLPDSAKCEVISLGWCKCTYGGKTYNCTAGCRKSCTDKKFSAPVEGGIWNPSGLLEGPAGQAQRSPGLLEQPQYSTRPGLLERPELLERQKLLERPAFDAQLGDARPAPVSAGASMSGETFANPKVGGLRLDWCLRWGRDCGEPAATTWCRTQGFDRATAWQPAHDIGFLTPTHVIGDGKTCGQATCDGFSSITCGGIGRSAGQLRLAPPPSRTQETAAPGYICQGGECTCNPDVIWKDGRNDCDHMGAEVCGGPVFCAAPSCHCQADPDLPSDPIVVGPWPRPPRHE